MRTRSAKLTQPTLTQSVSTTPTSSSSQLPPELIAHIQALAEEEETPGEIKRLRAAFELVNKEWYNMVDHFTHLVITHSSDVTKLTAKLRSSKLRALLTAKTRTISIELGEVNRSAELEKLCGLLKWVNQAESISIRDCSLRGWTSFGLSSSSNVVNAFASFANLRHFAFDHGPARSLRYTLVSVKRINEVAGWWPKLESFPLSRCHIHRLAPSDAAAEAFGSCTRLHTLSLDYVVGSDALWNVVRDVSPTLRSLHLVTTGLDATIATPTAIDCLAALAPQLTALSFTGRASIITPSNTPGVLDGVIPQLGAVARLALDASTLSPDNLAAALCPLANLTALEFKEVPAEQVRGLLALDVIDVIKRARALRSVRLCASACAQWSADERRRVERAATNKDIKIVWAN